LLIKSTPAGGVLATSPRALSSLRNPGPRSLVLLIPTVFLRIIRLLGEPRGPHFLQSSPGSRGKYLHSGPAPLALARACTVGALIDQPSPICAVGVAWVLTSLGSLPRVLACQDSRGAWSGCWFLVSPCVSGPSRASAFCPPLCIRCYAQPHLPGSLIDLLGLSPVPCPTGLSPGGEGEYCESSVHIHT